MHTLLILLACLACTDYGRRVQKRIEVGVAGEAWHPDLQSIEGKQIPLKVGRPELARTLSKILLVLRSAAALQVVDASGARRFVLGSACKAPARSGVVALMTRQMVEEVANVDRPDDLEERLRLRLPEYDGIKSTLTDVIKNECNVDLEHMTPFGSQVNGFCSGTSDLDICLTVSSQFDADISVPNVGRRSSIFNQKFLRQLVKCLQAEDADRWKLTDESKLIAKVPVATFRYADKLDVDLTVNQDVDVLNQQTINLLFFASLELDKKSTVADLWQVLREDFENEDLLGPNFDPTGAIPRRFPAFRLQLLLLEFFVASGYVSMDEDNTITASQLQRRGLEFQTLRDMQCEFYRWCSDSATWVKGDRVLAFRLSQPADTLHTRDPWNRDFRNVQFAPFKKLFAQRNAELQR